MVSYGNIGEPLTYKIMATQRLLLYPRDNPSTVTTEAVFLKLICVAYKQLSWPETLLHAGSLTDFITTGKVSVNLLISFSFTNIMKLLPSSRKYGFVYEKMVSQNWV